MIRAGWSLLGLGAWAAAAAGQPLAPQCERFDNELPAALAGWRVPAAISSPAVPMGRVVRLSLTPSAGSNLFEAAFSFQVERGGTYEIALSDAAWIDVVRDGEALTSAAHRHGPRCSTIRKIVSFRLMPGAYQLHLTRSPAAMVTLAIVPA